MTRADDFIAQFNRIYGGLGMVLCPAERSGPAERLGPAETFRPTEAIGPEDGSESLRANEEVKQKTPDGWKAAGDS